MTRFVGLAAIVVSALFALYGGAVEITGDDRMTVKEALTAYSDSLSLIADDAKEDVGNAIEWLEDVFDGFTGEVNE